MIFEGVVYLENALSELQKSEEFLLGVCKAEGLKTSEERKLKLLQTPFLRKNISIEARINPKFHLSSAKSVIVVCVGYSAYLNGSFSMGNGMIGRFSDGANCVDYHIAVSEKIKRIVSLLEKVCGSFEYYFQVDTGDLVERDFLLEAGIAAKGNNGCLYTERYGSFFNIGLLVTDIEFEVISKYLSNVSPPKMNCDKCGICEKACSGKAIAKGNLDCEKCISYITQKKGELNLFQEKLVADSGYLYGCDICQKACPYNKKFLVKKEDSYVELGNFMNMTNRQFKELYGNTAIGWRGLSVIKRNAEIIMRNGSSVKDGLEN